MSALDFEEQEKIDRLKAWWAANGNIILLSLAILVASVAGNRLWHHYKSQQAEQAADLYAVLQQQLDKGGEAAKIRDAALLLTEGFASSGYASRAALISAQASFKAGDIPAAKTMLQWVLDKSEEMELKDLARLRLAGILLDEQQFEQALSLLNAKHGSSFVGLYADLRGDVLVASGDVKEARAAYQQALDRLDERSSYQNIVQMKMDALRD
ncbi:MAG TPA: tetratricopeptide repeat protein [Nitrosomonas mobilis]|nr:tetratricopeptide repeat protein [Nitrosomonas mobilis]